MPDDWHLNNHVLSLLNESLSHLVTAEGLTFIGNLLPCRDDIPTKPEIRYHLRGYRMCFVGVSVECFTLGSLCRLCVMLIADDLS